MTEVSRLTPKKTAYDVLPEPVDDVSSRRCRQETFSVVGNATRPVGRQPRVELTLGWSRILLGLRGRSQKLPLIENRARNGSVGWLTRPNPGAADGAIW